MVERRLKLFGDRGAHRACAWSAASAPQVTCTRLAGRWLPTDCNRRRRAHNIGVTEIEVHVAEFGEFFNHIDPSPFRNRDLDPHAEAFIVD